MMIRKDTSIGRGLLHCLMAERLNKSQSVGQSLICCLRAGGFRSSTHLGHDVIKPRCQVPVEYSWMSNICKRVKVARSKCLISLTVIMEGLCLKIGVFVIYHKDTSVGRELLHCLMAGRPNKSQSAEQSLIFCLRAGGGSPFLQYQWHFKTKHHC